jgi:hypothetical protein
MLLAMQAITVSTQLQHSLIVMLCLLCKSPFCHPVSCAKPANVLEDWRCWYSITMLTEAVKDLLRGMNLSGALCGKSKQHEGAELRNCRMKVGGCGK